MIVDILMLIGTFLLAIEAIKLKNLTALRKSVIERVGEIINPRIVYEDDEQIPEIDNQNSKSISPHTDSDVSNRTFFAIFFSALVLVGVFISLLLINHVNPISSLFNKLNFLILKLLVFSAASFFLGAIFWTVTIYLLKLFEYLLIKIEENTKSGIIGIMGFVVILVAFIVKWSYIPMFDC